MIIEVSPVSHVPGKLADVTLRFEPGEPLFGFTLGGFQIWLPRDGPYSAITYPSRSWTLPSGGVGTVVFLKDGRVDKHLDPPVSVALKDAIMAAYEARTGGARRPRPVAAAPRAIAPPAAPPRPLRPRAAVPLGTLVRRVADVAAP